MIFILFAEYPVDIASVCVCVCVRVCVCVPEALTEDLPCTRKMAFLD